MYPCERWRKPGESIGGLSLSDENSGSGGGRQRKSFVGVPTLPLFGLMRTDLAISGIP
jgi:hypothetical protein